MSDYPLAGPVSEAALKELEAHVALRDAAPELLKACEHALEWFEHPDQVDEQDVIDELGSAICKAKNMRKMWIDGVFSLVRNENDGVA